MRGSAFKDRVEAGRLLGEELVAYARGKKNVIVLGLPRGGLPVAREVAEKIGAPLDVMVVRKLGVPGWEELAMGAIASGGVRVLNHDVMRSLHISEKALEKEVGLEMKELKRRELAYRGHAGAPEVKGRTVLLVDDGIATGSTMRAAVEALRLQGAAAIVVAVPVAAADTCREIESTVDRLVTLMRPEVFGAVGHWYEQFPQVEDEEVREILEQAARPTQAAYAG
ncbi:MAG: phosphoribosyltransferase [Akkermansiaceae bacterium]|jgi:putative phosphoribosyl transferase|nr:phosphoribosyltransferase [Akkermansiaceae bacterium]